MGRNESVKPFPVGKTLLASEQKYIATMMSFKYTSLILKLSPISTLMKSMYQKCFFQYFFSGDTDNETEILTLRLFELTHFMKNKIIFVFTILILKSLQILLIFCFLFGFLSPAKCLVVFE